MEDGAGRAAHDPNPREGSMVVSIGEHTQTLTFRLILVFVDRYVGSSIWQDMDDSDLIGREHFNTS